MNILTDENMMEIAAVAEAQTVINHTDVLQETVKLAQDGLTLTGDCLPWMKTHDKFRFRSGEVTLWCGQNGSGKSLVMTQAALFMSLYTKVLIASMEMPPHYTHLRLMRQASGCAKPTEMFMVNTAARIGQNLWYYDQLDTVKQEKIIAMMHWAATRIGVKHIMVDSLVKCGIRPDDYAGQHEFMDRMTWCAKRYGIHIHLVLHTRKGARENDMPDKYDIKGAGELADLASNIILVHRDKEAGVDETGKQKPDGYLRVAKQRNGEWEGTWGFWWHEASQQWTPVPGKALPWPNVEEQYH